jgi:hypothetical protein
VVYSAVGTYYPINLATTSELGASSMNPKTARLELRMPPLQPLKLFDKNKNENFLVHYTT